METKMTVISKSLAGAVLAVGLMVLAPALQIDASAAEVAVAPENNPPGDIPDSQVFIDYAGPGFAVQVPEGWSRNDVAGGAVFTDKYNFVEISSAPASAAPTLDSVQAGVVVDMTADGRAVAVSRISQVTLQGGPAARIEYQSNSEPNAVTGKQIRLDRVRYLYFANGQVVTLDMAAPAGADNVDQWLLMANSVKLG
jgi:antitoxin (DNA-binding transcriptional repressor) of toxin-antitoxin stability system